MFQLSRSTNYTDAQAAMFKALGHPSRLRMAEALMNSSLCVGELRKLINADMSTASRHLAILRTAGIIADEKRGQNVYYTLRLTCLRQILLGTAAELDKQTQARQAQLSAMMAP